MKKTLFAMLLMGAGCFAAYADLKPAVKAAPMQENEIVAEIKFDTLQIDLGTFSSKDPEQKCQFKFTNTGGAPLVIQQVLASCGCTVPTYPKAPIKPGQSGVIDITYNGTNKFPGRFRKTITVRSNAKTEIIRLVVSGMMTE